MDENEGFANFNHHENVNRLATRCTASQVLMAIKQGLLLSFGPEESHVWVNDCDQDVCTSIWLLEHWDRVSGQKSEPLINRLLYHVDVLDTCAGAFPIETASKPIKEMCWIFEPYTASRTSGKIQSMGAQEMLTVIEAVCSRISQYSIGMGKTLEPDLRYETLAAQPKWHLVREEGNEARTAMRQNGIRGFVSYRGLLNNGNHCYSLGNLTPFRGLPLGKLYDALNKHEDIGAENVDRWGGSDSCGGSPREHGSKLGPEELGRVINKILDQKKVEMQVGPSQQQKIELGAHPSRKRNQKQKNKP
jgi:hypothetical protein